jgi:hypothetical protein
MRTFTFLLILFIIFISCDKNLYVKYFCKDCDQKMNVLIEVDTTSGRMVYDNTYKRYVIEVAHNNGSMFFMPCRIPYYFNPVEMDTVDFSGKVIEDPLVDTRNVRLTYYCIKLDTIYRVTSK